MVWTCFSPPLIRCLSALVHHGLSLTSATCLDVGCNVGLFTLEVVRHFPLASMLGSELDPRLVGRAKGNLKKYKEYAEKKIAPSRIEIEKEEKDEGSEKEEKMEKSLKRSRLEFEASSDQDEERREVRRRI